MDAPNEQSLLKLRDELITALVAKRFTLVLTLLDVLEQRSTSHDERIWIAELREIIERDQHGGSVGMKQTKQGDRLS